MRTGLDLQCAEWDRGLTAPAAGFGATDMTSRFDDTADTLRRIASALERMAPPAPTPPDFAGGVFFTLEPKRGAATPVEVRVQALDLLVGIEAQKAQVVSALARFAAGAPVNHLLLWGARGGGKSALLKSAAAAQAAQTPTFRLLEIDRDQLDALPDLFARLRPLPFRVLVFCDDLSFEAGASAAKSLKSALEGGVAGPPDNVLFAATSNRRHLAPERHDEAAGMLAAAEQAEETVSVSDRFGLWIGFPPWTRPPTWRRCADMPTGTASPFPTSTAAPCSGPPAAAVAPAASPGSSSGSWRANRG